jgi:hypothetical protein
VGLFIYNSESWLICNRSVGTKIPGGASIGASISAHCGSCFTTGKGIATTNGVGFNDTIFKDPFEAAEEFFRDPLALIQESFDAEMDFSLSNFTGHFEFDITFAGTGTYDVSIPLPDTPVGGSVKHLYFRKLTYPRADRE